MEDKKYQKTSKFGTWEKRPNGTYYFKEEVVTSAYDPILGWHEVERKINEKEPIDMGLCRSCTINVIFCRTYDDQNEWDGKKTIWFKQTMTYTLRPDMTLNLWLLQGEGKLFIKDLYGQGFCTEVALGESTPNYTVKASKPVKIANLSEAQELAKTTKYCFNKVETDGQAITAYITTV